MKRSQKAKGSAEAATSPSRGSNNPYQENAVNRQQDTTVDASSASEVTSDPIDDVADLDFQPWTAAERKDEGFQPPTNSEWNDYGSDLLPIVRLSLLTMHKSKAELIAMFESDSEALMDLHDKQSDAAEIFRQIGCIAQLLEAASARLLVAAAAFASTAGDA